jgi:hypothetical protein
MLELCHRDCTQNILQAVPFCQDTAMLERVPQYRVQWHAERRFNSRATLSSIDLYSSAPHIHDLNLHAKCVDGSSENRLERVMNREPT